MTGRHGATTRTSGPVLGIGGSDHDFSAALVVDGRIRVAIEDERVQRVKHGRTHWHTHPARDATEYCLSAAGIDLEQVTDVFCCDDLDRPTEWLDWSRVTFVNHHTAHAAASFYTASSERSALLVIDGHGSPIRDRARGDTVETISIGWADPSSFLVHALQAGVRKPSSSTWHYATQNSIGWLYEIVTTAVGFGAHGHGKTMGLAAYGTPDLVSSMAEFTEIPGDGRFRFDPYGGIWEWLQAMLSTRSDAMQVRADLAFAVQEIFGDAVVAAAKAAYEQHPSPTLSFGGGCALNTLANTRILDETPFERVAVFPAAGDNGLSVGAALYGVHALLGRPRPPALADWRARAVYTGREYTSRDVDETLKAAPAVASTPTDLGQATARALLDGEVVAVCRGRSEIGPRALGNRSLLALPGSARIRDHINLNIKHRESFRPLAPVVPLEHLSTYFDDVEESPYMLFVATVRDEYRERLTAVTHVDGTARVQTVRRDDNPFLSRLLHLIGEASGIPVLLNTSLNFRGQPIVETPADAVEFLLRRPIDLLVLGDRLVRKHSPWAAASTLPSWKPALTPPAPSWQY